MIVIFLAIFYIAFSTYGMYRINKEINGTLRDFATAFFLNAATSFIFGFLAGLELIIKFKK